MPTKRVLKLGKTHLIKIDVDNTTTYYRTGSDEWSTHDLLHVTDVMAIELYEARKLLKQVFETLTSRNSQDALNKLYPKIHAQLKNY